MWRSSSSPRVPPFAASAAADAPGVTMNMPLAPSQTIISDEEFARFCEFFYRKTGIMFDTQKKYFAERRIIDRMARLGCTTFREYFATIRFEASGEEMQRLVNQMTVNETYF